VRIPAALCAREPRTAARSAALILAVCAVVVAALTVVQESSAGLLINVVSWAVIAGVAGGAVACRVLPPERLDRTGVFPLVALLGLALICTLNLLTRDPSAAAQAFFAFPVLWAASHLRTGAVVLVTGAAVASDALTLFLLEPAAQAATDFSFFGAVLVVMAGMLLRAGHVQDRLVTALQEQATVDSLTGLVNRRVFDGALEQALTQPVAGGTALVLIDVDAFKSINDSHGHPVGDDVLVHLAAVLRGNVRADDAVLSRLGGDELAVLLPGTPAGAAERRAEELLDTVRSTPFPLADGSALALSISVGVAHAPQRSSDLRALYAAADAALYEAKRAGRGRVSVASV
jgi:diguanylate cyclase (GGDEF)-like protein